MASLTDILTTAKNIVTAVNDLGQTFLKVNGSRSTAAISAATLVTTGQGRLCRIAVTTAGTTLGTVYDASSTGVTTSPIYSIPNALGVVEVSLPTNNGIVVAPGTGQVVTVSYS